MEQLNILAEHFDAIVEEDCDAHVIKFDNEHGQGEILGINFTHGISALNVDIKLNYDLQVEYNLGRRHPILFTFNEDVPIRLMNETGVNMVEVTRKEAAIFAPKGDYSYSIHFPAHEKVQCIIIGVIRFLFLRKIECDLDTIPEVLQEMFKDTAGENNFNFKSSTDPLLSKQVQDIFATDLGGLEQKLILEAKSLNLITTLIKQFRKQRTQTKTTYQYRRDDFDKINEAKNHLIDHVGTEVTVKDLAHLVGMNTNKLQKGFKMIFGKSIRQFVISMRMHQAMYLFEQGEYNVGEIANLVGYTNKGHFSQLFKKEFGLLPREYSSRNISSSLQQMIQN